MNAQSPKSPNERRQNSSLRNQAQAWFDALRLHIAEVEGAETIANLIKDWKKPEDVMHAYPALVPLFLDMIWRSRKAPGFADLFRTESGDVAEAPTEVLSLSQKTFDDIIIAHLLGTARLLCVRLQNEWVVAEREKRRGKLSRMPIVGATLRGLGLLSPPKAEILLADYPRKGLYEALKPFLSRRAQFTLVEALSSLPTRTVSTLGPIVGALDSPAVIRALANLDRANIKFALELAETFVGAGKSAQVEEGVADADQTAALGLALSDMLREGPRFVILAADNKQLAKDAVTKLTPVVGAEIWGMMGDIETWRRIAECPAAIAATLRALTTEINERVSIALSEIVDNRVATFAVQTLRDGSDPETFLCWIRDEAYLMAWKQLVQNLNRSASVPGEGEPLARPHQESIKSVCTRGARVFSELSEPEKKAA